MHKVLSKRLSSVHSCVILLSLQLGHFQTDNEARGTITAEIGNVVLLHLTRYFNLPKQSNS